MKTELKMKNEKLKMVSPIGDTRGGVVAPLERRGEEAESRGLLLVKKESHGRVRIRLLQGREGQGEITAICLYPVGSDNIRLFPKTIFDHNLIGVFADSQGVGPVENHYIGILATDEYLISNEKDSKVRIIHGHFAKDGREAFVFSHEKPQTFFQFKPIIFEGIVRLGRSRASSRLGRGFLRLGRRGLFIYKDTAGGKGQSCKSKKRDSVFHRKKLNVRSHHNHKVKNNIVP
jgi:hypothetical protein